MRRFQPDEIAEIIASQYRSACLAELSALKPGNVHLMADGHGMVVEDFIKSAEASCNQIAIADATVGQRILASVQATWQAVGCNTNLGIVLLSAPIANAFYGYLEVNQQNFYASLCKVLDNLTVEDANLAYCAIRLANPAGLGTRTHHDVSQVSTLTLKQAMEAAKDIDRIAYQYANNFEDVFQTGLPILAEYLKRWERESWATTALFLAYLSSFNDSHIERKFGASTASIVRNEASMHWAAFKKQDNPKSYLKELLQFDKSLKERGINPGTSADLTVSTLLIRNLTNYR